MKPFLFVAFLGMMPCSISFAQVPEKKPHQFYSELWLNSPFTTKPIVTGDPKISNPLDDYHLTGIAPIEGGYRITIANKKDKNAKKIIIEPGNDSGFEVVSVDRNPEISLGTTVTLKKGSMEGVVRFEPNLVVLNAPASTTKPANNPPGVVDPNQPSPPGGQAAPNTTARPRIIPPIVPTQQKPPSNSPQSRPSRK